MLQFLQGKKTYIVAVIMGIITVLEYLGKISPEARNQILNMLTALGLATLRAGVNKKSK